ncbi:hypothetical protein N066_02107 [Mycobacterium tuberculosis variant africanum MAL010111]|nr:hypothetical protein N066_02107 [Mycobacterium tuberculosis variant africanum MAL010111]
MVGKLALGSESSRQTQNPERGRKPASGKSVRSKRFQRVVRPKTPRGDGNSKSSTTSAAAACSRSRQTQNPERGRKREEPSHLGLPPAGRQTQNPERGRKLNNTFFERGAVESVVRPKTPRGDGNTETQHQPDNLILASSDPKPREGTETRKRSTSLTILFSRRQTQNPERGRKHFERELVHSPPFRSSDPKPREGTETPRGWRMRCARKCRQTQNPERGRKPDDEQRHTEPRIRQVVRPKTPRGDGNLHPLVADTADFRESSDPKPREGTETGNCVTARLAGRLSSDPKPREGTETPSDAGTEVDDKPSSDPKPREGTETSTPSVPHTGPVPCRQTQNPERGRKPDGTELSGFYQVVVRPKTPRGDGNPHGGTWTSATIGVVRPKTPRGDGNWTQNRTGCGRCSSRQTQNPERGRKRISPATPQPRYCSMSSDPKPREGTETHRR